MTEEKGFELLHAMRWTTYGRDPENDTLLKHVSRLLHTVQTDKEKAIYFRIMNMVQYFQ